MTRNTTVLFLAVLWLSLVRLIAAEDLPQSVAAREVDKLAGRVTIFRDAFGVPHIDADDCVAAAFALAYVQCEDYFWQIEDSLAWGAGRSAELYGISKLDDDLMMGGANA